MNYLVKNIFAVRNFAKLKGRSKIHCNVAVTPAPSSDPNMQVTVNKCSAKCKF